MTIPNINDLYAFLAVAKERNFTRAAAKLGVSQSALSQTIRHLEERLGLRLLERTTRSVSTTEAGERLLRTAAPRLEEIEAEIVALQGLRISPAGTLRITAGEHAIRTILWPALADFLPKYPDVSVEVVAGHGLTDIVAERFDAGIRLADQVAQDMIAVPIGPPMRFIVVGSPAYLAQYPMPAVPQDLDQHKCINLRLPTYGGLYAWEFEKDGQDLKVRVTGQLIFDTSYSMLDAALAGLGLAYIPEDMTASHIADGRLQQVLNDWSPRWPGYHVYYPAHRQSSPALRALVNELRYRL